MNVRINIIYVITYLSKYGSWHVYDWLLVVEMPSYCLSNVCHCAPTKMSKPSSTPNRDTLSCMINMKYAVAVYICYKSMVVGHRVYYLLYICFIPTLYLLYICFIFALYLWMSLLRYFWYELCIL